MKEQLINFETAKLAKEKGFDWDTEKSYIERLSYTFEDRRKHEDISMEYIPPRVLLTKFGDKTHNKIVAPAPTQSLLQKWLREKHELHIALQRIFECNVEPVQFQGYVVYIGGKAFETDYPINKELVGNYFSTYEEALEDGLQETLKLIEL